MWLRILGGIIVKKISQEKIRISNHGAGLSCGMKIARGGWESPVISLKG